MIAIIHKIDLSVSGPTEKLWIHEFTLCVSKIVDGNPNSIQLSGFMAKKAISVAVTLTTNTLNKDER